MHAALRLASEWKARERQHCFHFQLANAANCHGFLVFVHRRDVEISTQPARSKWVLDIVILTCKWGTKQAGKFPHYCCEHLAVIIAAAMLFVALTTGVNVATVLQLTGAQVLFAAKLLQWGLPSEISGRCVRPR